VVKADKDCYCEKPMADCVDDAKLAFGWRCNGNAELQGRKKKYWDRVKEQIVDPPLF
jgi:hypothetical protein